MRISDWSSDVCSSDLVGGIPEQVESLDHPGMPRGDDLRYGAEKATGMLVPPGDSTAMAKAAALLLETPDLRACLSHNAAERSEEHTSELQSLMRISYAVICLKKKTTLQPTLNIQR